MSRYICRFPVLVSLLPVLFSTPAAAAGFNTNFLYGDSAKADLSRFDRNDTLPDGEYTVEISVNGEWKGRFPLRLQQSGHTILIPQDDVPKLGLRNTTPPPQADEEGYIALSSLVPPDSYTLNTGQFQLMLNVPQAMLNSVLKGYVDPSLWDQGVNAAMVSYNANYYHAANKRDGSDNDNAYLTLNSGLNLAGWQFRDQSSLTYSSGQSTKWNTNTRYLQRGFPAIKSDFRAGDSYTSGDLFDSVRFRGATLKTDMRMYPDTWQGFSPVIRGVAQTNALVKIYQDSQLIWQQSVPPGPFVVDSLLPTGSGGDLQVEINEADGQINHFMVPFSAVPNMLKEGLFNYELNAGEVQLTDNAYHPDFAQLNIRYGINNTLTGYGGMIAAKNYQAFLLGSGFNLPIGALSLDVTHSDARFDQDIPRYRGESYKVAYSRFIHQTNTNFSLAAYRYSTSGYFSLTDAVQYQELLNRQASAGEISPQSQSYRQRSTFNININQRIGADYGSVYLAGTLRDYWGGQDSTREYQLGYANNWQDINYTLSAGRTRYSKDSSNPAGSSNNEETRINLTLSVPLTVSGRKVYLTANSMIKDSRYQSSNIGLSGTAGQSNALSYNVNAAHQQAGGTTFSTSAAYRAAPATLNASYSESGRYRQLGAGATGSLVVWSGGILTANQPGETFAIVNVPGTANAIVNNDRNVTTNTQGQVLVPYLSAYRKNALILDASQAPENAAELLGNVQDIVPYAGAVTLVNFRTDNRQEFYLHAVRHNGKPLPFGTEVTDGDNNSIGYVGQNSLIYIRSETQPAQINVRLTDTDSGYCRITLTPGPQSTPLRCAE
ncbi:fimbria/pilus outer membrane usher protein [Morganella morganii]|uniref:fimbria/pilus outer membrane usher protein n=1 Tax=Morganella morganii TaxID=582 RepID=UPI003D7F50A8